MLGIRAQEAGDRPHRIPPAPLKGAHDAPAHNVREHGDNHRDQQLRDQFHTPSVEAGRRARNANRVNLSALSQPFGAIRWVRIPRMNATLQIPRKQALEILAKATEIGPMVAMMSQTAEDQINEILAQLDTLAKTIRSGDITEIHLELVE